MQKRKCSLYQTGKILTFWERCVTPTWRPLLVWSSSGECCTVVIMKATLVYNSCPLYTGCFQVWCVNLKACQFGENAPSSLKLQLARVGSNIFSEKHPNVWRTTFLRTHRLTQEQSVTLWIVSAREAFKCSFGIERRRLTSRNPHATRPYYKMHYDFVCKCVCVRAWGCVCVCVCVLVS